MVLICFDSPPFGVNWGRLGIWVYHNIGKKVTGHASTNDLEDQIWCAKQQPSTSYDTNSCCCCCRTALVFSMSSGWWFQSLWKILVNWDGYSQYMGKSKMFQTTNQSCLKHVSLFLPSGRGGLFARGIWTPTLSRKLLFKQEPGMGHPWRHRTNLVIP